MSKLPLFQLVLFSVFLQLVLFCSGGYTEALPLHKAQRNGGEEMPELYSPRPMESPGTISGSSMLLSVELSADTETVLERRRLDRLHRAQALAVSASDLVRAQYHAQNPGGAVADAPVKPFTMLMQTKVQLHDALHTWMRSGSTGMVGIAIGCGVLGLLLLVSAGVVIRWWRREGSSYYSEHHHEHKRGSLPVVDYTKKPRRPTARYSITLPKKKSSVYDVHYDATGSSEITKKKPSIPYGALASSMLPTEERARLDAANDTKADADDDIPIPGPTPHFDKRFSSASSS